MSTSVLTTSRPEAVWLSVNPSFSRLEQPLLQHLRGERPIAHWGYVQTPDEPSSLDVAMTLLHDYMKGCDRPLHLMGHSTGGLVGLLYARQYPQRVKSLTLLGVGVNPALDWKGPLLYPTGVVALLPPTGADPDGLQPLWPSMWPLSSRTARTVGARFADVPIVAFTAPTVQPLSPRGARTVAGLRWTGG
jgi:pimeloyl-ACP methyl ester carboxylesterase